MLKFKFDSDYGKEGKNSRKITEEVNSNEGPEQTQFMGFRNQKKKQDTHQSDLWSKWKGSWELRDKEVGRLR